MGSSSMVQWMPSLLKPAKMSMLMERLSQRKTPAKPSPKGTTALLKTLLDRLLPSRPMMGLPSKRHSGVRVEAGGSCQGMLGKALPMILAIINLLYWGVKSGYTVPRGSVGRFGRWAVQKRPVKKEEHKKESWRKSGVFAGFPVKKAAARRRGEENGDQCMFDHGSGDAMECRFVCFLLPALSDGLTCRGVGYEECSVGLIRRFRQWHHRWKP